MNDRFLFKAKRIDNGEWVQGYYANCLFPSSGIKTGHFIIVYPGKYYEIYTSTLCQCTGLRDRNKALIWENDIVITPKEDGYSLIRWDETEARWEMYDDAEEIVMDFDNYWASEIEVVGSYIDNPEWLEMQQ